jgi:hypothetical protein
MTSTPFGALVILAAVSVQARWKEIGFHVL